MNARKVREAAKAAMNIGQVLIRMCVCSEEQVATAVERHRATGRRLGEALVELGFCSGDDLVDALALQKRLRSHDDVAAHAALLDAARERLRAGMRVSAAK